MQIHLEIDKGTIAEVQRGLGDQKGRWRSAISGAINETLAEKKTAIAKKIYDKFNLSSARIKQDIHVAKASQSNLSGELRLEDTRAIGLRQFGARQTEKGVSYAIERGGARKFIPHAFIQTAKGGEHVFIRYKGTDARGVSARGLRPGGVSPASGLVGRFPIRRLAGISVRDAAAKSGIIGEEFPDAQEVFEKNLQQRINSILEGWADKRAAAQKAA